MPPERFLRALALAVAAPALAHPTTIAGRGGNYETPEQTLIAYEISLDVGTEFLELDVWLSADGVPVCIHDEDVDRTTDGTGPVHQKTLAELKQLDAGSWFSPSFAGEQIPTLEEFLLLSRQFGGAPGPGRAGCDGSLPPPPGCDP
ncbi:MAG: glycerophosphodiester phosphodiesterase family protein [Myxococcota bacterium]|nr:glycerophosphodiester phosphodiesterase family protein [Myxococcota bacterium]